MDKEIMQLNLTRSVGRNIRYFFNDETTYPEKILKQSDLYGSYYLVPCFHVRLFDPEYVRYTEKIYLSPTREVWVLEESVFRGQPGKVATDSILYLPGTKFNENWAEENKDCRYLQQVTGQTTLPIAVPNLQQKVNEICERFPMLKL
jgi:hypothetical protein